MRIIHTESCVSGDAQNRFEVLDCVTSIQLKEMGRVVAFEAEYQYRGMVHNRYGPAIIWRDDDRWWVMYGMRHHIQDFACKSCRISDDNWSSGSRWIHGMNINNDGTINDHWHPQIVGKFQ